MVLSISGDLEKLSQKLTKYGRGWPAGTGGHKKSETPSKKLMGLSLSMSVNYYLEIKFPVNPRLKAKGGPATRQKTLY